MAVTTGRPRQVDIRRAISSAYYSVFHALLTAMADEFIGVANRSSKLYGLIYRSVEHRWLRDLCADLGKPSPPAKYSDYLPAGGIGTDLVTLATAIVDLQERRHAADYNPMLVFAASDAKFAIATARAALTLMARAPADSRKIFLTLLAFPPRR